MTIKVAEQSQFEAITNVWEASVRATHDFLPEAYISELRPRLLNEWLPAVDLRVFVGNDGVILGFSGVSEDKLEMLFIAPETRGKGVGKALLAHAIAEMGVRLVDVNEQNVQAVGFYAHAGFETFARSPLDGQGQPYPLLHLRLAAGPSREE